MPGLSTRLSAGSHNEPIFTEHATEPFGDVAAVVNFLPEDHDQAFSVREEQKIILRGQFHLGLRRHMNAILRSPISIQVRPADDLRQAINHAFIPVQAVPDLRPIRNSVPILPGLHLAVFPFLHGDAPRRRSAQKRAVTRLDLMTTPPMPLRRSIFTGDARRGIGPGANIGPW